MSSRDPDFNWKAAEVDVEEMGGDLDMLYTRNAKNRDSYLREMDLNPDRYKKKSSEPSSSTSAGCYIATCVYGSYDCPQVWTLRRYRDYSLAKTWYGRAFIHTYYAFSPTLVKRFGKKKWFTKFWKSNLDKTVEILNEKGIENTPYQDKGQ